jgi:tRNA1(Val) A37 N6-methylase TrmN6
LCRWAIRARTDRVFDPAAGDGAFLRAAARFTDVAPTGVELDAGAARQAGVPCGDFFETRPGRFDVVVGNPPFIRYQKFDRALALTRAREAGLELNGEASAWSLPDASERSPGSRPACSRSTGTKAGPSCC